MVELREQVPCKSQGLAEGASSKKEDTMLNEIIFIAGLFATRIVLPVMLMLVLGEWIARRTNRNEAKS